MKHWDRPKKVAGDRRTGDPVVAALSSEKFVRVEDNFRLSDHLIYQRFTENNEDVTFQLHSKAFNGDVCLQYRGASFLMTIRSEKAAELEASFTLPRKIIDYSSLLIASMPGLVTSVSVKVGDQVSAGTEMCVLEAMKMQNCMSAGRSGVVSFISLRILHLAITC